MRRIALVLVLIASAPARGGEPAETPGPAEVAGRPRRAEPIERPGCPNLHRVSAGLYRGAQPTAGGMRELAKLGVKTIVNLRIDDSDVEALRGLDLGYEQIGVSLSAIGQRDIVRFLRLAADPEKAPVFVHCHSGAHRTGVMCALYRIAVQGWSKDEALNEMFDGRFGFAEDRRKAARHIQDLDIAAIRREAGIPAPAAAAASTTPAAPSAPATPGAPAAPAAPAPAHGAEDESEPGSERAKLLSGPYVIGLGKREATVAWQTTDSVRWPVVFRPLAGEGETPGKWKRVEAPRFGRFHAVCVTGLVPGTEYEAKVLPGRARGFRLAFRTAPEKLDRFTFFVYGDTRTYPEDHACVAKALRAEADRLAAHTFVLHTGDLAAGGSDEFETAEQFFVPAAPALERLPLVVAKGNHEVSERDLFDRYFPVPEPPRLARGARDLCFGYGAVRILVMDQYVERNEFERAEWLARMLAEATDKWRFVAFHAPVYSSGHHGSDPRWRSLVEPTLRAGRVHAVFCGHDHDYERTRPIGGVTHFVTGGGGAPLRPVHRPYRPQPDWSERFEAAHHFLTVEISPERLLVRAHRVNADGASEAFDSVEIPKEAAWPPAGEYGEIVDGGPGSPGQYDWGRGDLAARVETLRVVFLVIGLGVLVGALLARIVQRRRRAQKRAA